MNVHPYYTRVLLTPIAKTLLVVTCVSAKMDILMMGSTVQVSLTHTDFDRQ